MNESYRDSVLRTELKDFTKAKERLSDDDAMRILHSAMGICTEAGELLDAVKKFIFYGKKLDKTNLREELGDLGFYEEMLMDVLLTVRNAIEQTNAKKLQERYKGRFSEERANDRDLDAERQILEYDPYTDGDDDLGNKGGMRK